MQGEAGRQEARSSCHVAYVKRWAGMQATKLIRGPRAASLGLCTQQAASCH